MNHPWLTPNRRKVLQIIARYPHMPNRSVIAKHMGWRTVTMATDALNTLYRLGLLDRSRNPDVVPYWIFEINDLGLQVAAEMEEIA